jgi:hypothetical protein
VPLSLLALLHPTAPPPGALVLGSGCPVALAPDPLVDAEQADLVVVAPDRAEEGHPGWLPAAAAQGGRALAQRGLVLVWGRRALRRRARRLLVRRGLQPATTFYLVPRRGVLLAPPPALRVATSVLPGALVLRRPDAPPPLAWLGEPRSGAFSVRRSPRTGAVLVESLDRWGRKLVTAKVAATAREEHARLTALAPAARRAGADVPDARLVELPGAFALVQRSVRGRSAARLLMRSRRRPEDVIELLTVWLTEWGKLTRRSLPFGATAARQELLDDLECLAPKLEAPYVTWVRERCVALDGVEVPVVAAHRDLTMWNVLLDDGRLGVIDWESATDDALALVDFEYAVVDALAAAGGYRSRVAAYGDASAAWVATFRDALVDALEVPVTASELASHACWLHHAANEQRRPEGEGRPFLEIARLAAR